MKILQYTLGLPPYRRGGLPRYSTDLSLELSKENEVTLLYPGKMPIFDSNKLKFKRKKSNYPFEVVEMENPLPVSLGLGINSSAPYMKTRDKANIVKFLKKISPEVIHIHTLMGLPIEFLEVAKSLKIKIVYTTHDFYGLCPKMLEQDPLKLLKSRKCTYDCMLCKNGPTLNKIKIMQSHIYMYLKESKLIKKIRENQKANIVNVNEGSINSIQEIKDRYLLRLYYQKIFKLIDVFHFNSSVSKDYIHKFFPNALGKTISITHTGIQDNRFKSSKHKKNIIKFGYIGPYDEKKGFFLLCDVLTKLRNKYTDFEVHFYGDLLDEPIFSKSWVYNHGILPNDQMYKAYENIDVLIMPSLWHETFGFSVLEALSYGDICLVSKSVGAKDILPVSNIFNDKKQLINLLNNILEINNLKKYRSSDDSLEQLLDFKQHVKKILTEIYN